MSTAVELFDKNKDMIGAMIPQGLGLTVDRFKQVMVFCTRITPKLLDCDPGSLVAAVAQVAQLGLDLTPAVGHAYLVPYKANCQLQIGYKGYIALALRGGGVKHITAYAVYEHDEFTFEYGTDERVVHKPALKDRGALVAAWAGAVLADGTRVFRVIGSEDIAKAEGFGQGRRDDSPWKQHRDEMARKTAIRRLVRDLVLSSAVQRAMAADDMVVKGMDGDIIEGEFVRDDAPHEPRPQEKRAQGLKSKLGDAPPPDDIKALQSDLTQRCSLLGGAPSQFRSYLLSLPEFAGKEIPPIGQWDIERLKWAVRAIDNGHAQGFASYVRPEGPPAADAPESDEIPL